MDEDELKRQARGIRSAHAMDAPPPPSASAVDLRAKGSRLWMVGIIVLGLLGVAGLTLFAFRGDKDIKETGRRAGEAEQGGPQPADGTQGMAEAEAVILQGMIEDVEAKPCNKGTVFDLANRLNKADRFADTARITTAWIKRCGPFPRLLWKTYYAYEQLEKWPEAEAVATDLVVDSPDDGDFWWWRGQARVKAGKLAAAAADFRQATAARPLEESRGASLMDLADIADKAGATCDAAAGIRLFTAANEGNVTRRARDQGARLHLAGNCDAAYGSGSTVIDLDPDKPVDTIKVTVGKASGTFLVAPRTGFTLLSHAFADKAGVTGSGAAVDTYAAGTLHQGVPAVASKMAIKGASAPAVNVLVVDDLPAAVDGVLGMSFLVRFDYQELDDQITLDSWADQ